MLLYALLGITCYALPAKTGNPVVVKSPVKPGVPVAKGWRNKDDRNMAQSLEAQLQRRIDEDSTNLSYAVQQLGRAGRRRQAEWRQKTTESAAIVELLRESRNELKKIDSSNTFFTFEYTREGVLGYTCREADNTIVIHFLNDINAIHELVHAWQIYTGKISVMGCQRFGDATIEQYCRPEIMAYRRQFAFDSASMRLNVKSCMGEVRNLSDITNEWLLGLQDQNGNYIFWEVIQRFYPVRSQEEWEKFLKAGRAFPASPQ